MINRIQYFTVLHDTNSDSLAHNVHTNTFVSEPAVASALAVAVVLRVSLRLERTLAQI